MRLDVSKALVAEGEGIVFSLEVSLPDTEVLGEAVTYPQPAKLSGTYTSMADTINVCGEMRFSAASRCGRCLSAVEKPLAASFDVVFALTPREDDPDVYVYDGAWIDLTEMAADAAQLALPMRWVCGEDCRGLCPKCGANRNETVCSCRIEGDAKHPLSALQQLLTEDESEV